MIKILLKIYNNANLIDLQSIINLNWKNFSDNKLKNTLNINIFLKINQFYYELF